MYPSSKTPYYGIFVKNSELYLAELGVNFVAKSLIRGLERNKLLKGYKYLKFVCSICFNLLKAKKFGIVYLHFVPVAVWPLYLFKKIRPEIPLIVNFHGGYIVDFSGNARSLSPKVFAISDLVIAPSDYLKKFMVQNFPVKKSKIIVSPSGGIDTKRFSPGEKEDRTKTEKLVIGFFSRISEGKGWEVFVDALFYLKQNGIPFNAIMIGGGTDHGILVRRLNELNIDQYVTIVGALSHKELPYHLSKFDINVFPTKLFESLGLVGLEAMACGVPVIGSNIGGLQSYIKDGYNGYLFEAGNGLELYRKISCYLSLPHEKKTEMSYNARRTALEYDSKKVARDLYKEIKSFANAE
ncbi:glycosyltransferase family 4 protein [Muricauda sp. NFXS6]|uniref:glycosyltransferase family 4 protein n=1 Tax=Allomuricauda sp. NFXS6 TaxID=2819094 RepID=UPI0032DF93B8